MSEFRWKVASNGLIPFGPGEGSDYVAVILFTVVAGRVFLLITREKESQGASGKAYPPLEKFPGGVVIADDGQNGDTLPLAVRREFRQETGLLQLDLELNWDNAISAEIDNREGLGLHRKTFFVVRVNAPEHPDMKLVAAEEVEDVFWAEASPGRQFPVQLPRAHREALEFALGNLSIFKVSLSSSGVEPQQERTFLERVRTIEPKAVAEVQPLEDGLTPFQRKELEKQQALNKKRR